MAAEDRQDGELEAGIETRLEASVLAALRRKPVNEDRLAGCVRALAPHSRRIRVVLAQAAGVLGRRGSCNRPLYVAAIQGLADADQDRAAALLVDLLALDHAGGLATLSACCSVADPRLTGPLARLAGNRHPQLAFAAGLARLVREESDGAHLAGVAAMIKESHRIELCVETLVPLLWRRPLPAGVAPALRVLRGAERHLGRWLVFAELAARAGDAEPLAEAAGRAARGPTAARAAWAMVTWALAGTDAPPRARPTMELVARLSDRPSADRDLTFLFRLADARVGSVRSMLEGCIGTPALDSATAVRAALYLARDHGRSDLLTLLRRAASNSRREVLRGLATACLCDAGERDVCRIAANRLAQSRQLSTMTWAALVAAGVGIGPASGPLVTEPRFRRIQLGWTA